jgi:methylenetetrahydrofolate--tRNA-(uracil-5-)-methyltransferase
LTDLIVIGGGLAGCEAAWQAAENGLNVALYEMRPLKMTGAHRTDRLAELVCSNSLGSMLDDRASGLLKEEMRRLGSLLLQCAQETAIPAGYALAVDREAFAETVTQRISAHPRIQIIQEEVTAIPASPTIIASGPLTSDHLTQAIQELTGQDGLSFYDAIAPVIRAESIDLNIAFRASRFSQAEANEGDYINCPFNRDQYYAFVEALRTAERIELREFEDQIRLGVKAGIDKFFEGCLPAEIIAERGEDSLSFGPMRPIGLRNPHNNERAYAVLQLRQDNLAASLYNIVGFQTNLTFAEQKRVFHMVPGLEGAEFERFGQMHRNTFIASPLLLQPTLQTRSRPDLFFAGQITGVEGYLGNIATGLLAGLNAARLQQGQPTLAFPVGTMLGALCHYITSADLKDFQPMKANFGILPELAPALRGRKERNRLHVSIALEQLEIFMDQSGLTRKS